MAAAAGSTKAPQLRSEIMIASPCKKMDAMQGSVKAVALRARGGGPPRVMPPSRPSSRPPRAKGHASEVPPAEGVADKATLLLPPEVLAALTSLDDKLVTVLESGAIRLVSTKWMLAQPADFCMPRRQELERLERSGVSPSPLLTSAQAVALIRRGDRSVGVLSQ